MPEIFPVTGIRPAPSRSGFSLNSGGGVDLNFTGGEDTGFAISVQNQIANLLNKIFNDNKWHRNEKGEIVDDSDEKVTDKTALTQFLEALGQGKPQDRFFDENGNLKISDALGQTTTGDLERASNPSLTDSAGNFLSNIGNNLSNIPANIEELVVSRVQNPTRIFSDAIDWLTGYNPSTGNWNPAALIPGIGTLLNLAGVGPEINLTDPLIGDKADGSDKTDSSVPLPEDQTIRPDTYVPSPIIGPGGRVEEIVVTHSGPTVSDRFYLTVDDLKNAGWGLQDLNIIDWQQYLPQTGTPAPQTDNQGQPIEEITVTGTKTGGINGVDRPPIENNFTMQPPNISPPNLNVGGGNITPPNNDTPVVEPPVNIPPQGPGGDGMPAMPPQLPPTTPTNPVFNFYSMPDFQLLPNTFGQSTPDFVEPSPQSSSGTK